MPIDHIPDIAADTARHDNQLGIKRRADCVKGRNLRIGNAPFDLGKLTLGDARKIRDLGLGQSRLFSKDTDRS